MIATIRALTGSQPRKYFGDSHDPSRAQVRDLKEETLRVFRSRVVNPKMAGQHPPSRLQRRAGADRDRRLFIRYDATAQVMDDWMYEQVAETYAMDPDMQRFLEEANPGRKTPLPSACWKQPVAACGPNLSNRRWRPLQALYLNSETLLEARGETPRGLMHHVTFPFSAIVGQTQLKTALLLCAVDPSLAAC